MTRSVTRPSWLTKQRKNYKRVEILIPIEEYEKIEAVSSDTRVGVGTLIKVVLSKVDIRQIALSLMKETT